MLFFSIIISKQPPDMLGSVFCLSRSAIVNNYCPIGGSIGQHLLISSAITADQERQKMNPNMSGGGIEKFGDREMGARQTPHFRGA